MEYIDDFGFVDEESAGNFDPSSPFGEGPDHWIGSSSPQPEDDDADENSNAVDHDVDVELEDHQDDHDEEDIFPGVWDEDQEERDIQLLYTADRYSDDDDLEIVEDWDDAPGNTLLDPFAHISSTPQSIDHLEVPSTSASGDNSGHTSPIELIDDVDGAIAVDDLEQRFNSFRDELNSLDQSRARIADAVSQLREIEAEQRRFWERELNTPGARHRSPIRAERATRHHPYRMPLQNHRRQSQDSNNNISRTFDELVELEMEVRPSLGSARRSANTPGLTRTAPGAAAAQPEFIDLTEEPDSPVQGNNARTRPNPPSFPLALPSTTTSQHRNPRRQMSLNHRTPSLTRSDGSVLIGGAPVIDLTMDDDPPPAAAGQTSQNSRAAQHADRLARDRAPRDITSQPAEVFDLEDENVWLGVLRQFPGGSLMAGGLRLFQPMSVFGPSRAHVTREPRHRAPDMPSDPLAGNLPNFNYRANGYNNLGAPKPVHEPPPPAREGFSRATGEDLAFVCPSCQQELAYDPDEDDANGPPTKKVRTRKDREEHHFWAVKESCYENRKPLLKNIKTGFRTDPKEPRKVFCAVDGCKTEILAKPAWVGLFL
ncbi:hypothetical protein B0H66DRAFT_606831 [Apodospora peruviana]|uniref:Uncharacterized protein n=1 Tax=Apodospora peruviana TaxID=516989 RepID=A0AAE0LZR5_9PEZI|nr:hypothetical protein B0H66DRAFT_606831 [Apodospora peruviana]